MLKAAVLRQREFLADAQAVQFTPSSEGLRGVLRKAMGERASRNRPQGLAASRSLHPSVQHVLLVGPLAETRWLASRPAGHPPLARRVRRIYGRSMLALGPTPYGRAVTQSGALFQPACQLLLKT